MAGIAGLRLGAGLLAGVLAVSTTATAQPAGDAVRTAVLDEMGRRGIPGLSLAIVEAGVVRYEAGFGFADVENAVPAKPETVYRLASVSKPITAVAVLKLHEQGRLDLDAPVWRYCADFPEKPWPVTARELLCHQGGIRHYRHDEPTLTRRFASFAESLALFRDDPLAARAGDRRPVFDLRLQPARLRGGRRRRHELPRTAAGGRVRARRDGRAPATTTSASSSRTAPRATSGTARGGSGTRRSRT